MSEQMAVKERPILFSGPMVRAILDGRKTQTRRVVKLNKVGHPVTAVFWDEVNDGAPASWVAANIDDGFFEPAECLDSTPIKCPYGRPGERLWVRETTVDVESHGYLGPVYVASEQGADILAEGLRPHMDDMTEVDPWEIRKRPAIHMPRKYCRLGLEITGVRCERLQAISGPDCWAEGITHDPEKYGSVTHAYRDLWESINGPASWDANPWVWVIEFRRLT